MFFKGKQTSLGIDIGTSSIKLVELQKEGEFIHLKNYAEYKPEDDLKDLITFRSSMTPFSETELTSILKNIISASGIESRRANFSIPVFSSFLTLIEMPQMSDEDIARAIEFQANKYIPVPLSEVFLNWVVIRENNNSIQQNSKDKIEVLLVAAPKDIIERYSRLASDVGFELGLLEVENFSLVRSLCSSKNLNLIIDIGARTSSVTIVDNGFIRLSSFLEFSGFHFTKAITERLKVDEARAERLKMENGLLKKPQNQVREAILPLFDKLSFFVESAISIYLGKNPDKEFEKIILTGGSSRIPGILEYFSERFKIPVEKGNPFFKISYPQILKDKIQEIAPNFSIACGLALGDFEV